jgi:hypothetical protein
VFDGFFFGSLLIFSRPSAILLMLFLDVVGDLFSWQIWFLMSWFGVFVSVVLWCFASRGLGGSLMSAVDLVMVW